MQKSKHSSPNDSYPLLGHISLALFSFCVFWMLRSNHIAGDGGLIARITEDRRWFVNNEIFGQAILQLVYRMLQPWHITPFEVMSLVSCFGGALAVFLLLYGSWQQYRLQPIWPIGLYASSGFLIYSCGHTEYYPMLLPVLFGYGFFACSYLQQQTKIHIVALIFVFACSLHLASLLALPSLLLLPVLTERLKDYRSIILVLLLLIPLFIIRDFPQWTGYSTAKLGSSRSVLHWFPHYGMEWRYAFFEWGHFFDWLYAWARSSWIFWPLILVGVYQAGAKSILRKDRLFLLVYTLCFTIWTICWHPDLGIEADWDLFALEAAPCMLLLLTYHPHLLKQSCIKTIVTILMITSCLIQFSHVVNRAELPHDGYGSITIQTGHPDSLHFTLNGRAKPLHIPRIREGVYVGKIIDQGERRSQGMYINVKRDSKAVIKMNNAIDH